MNKYKKYFFWKIQTKSIQHFVFSWLKSKYDFLEYLNAKYIQYSYNARRDPTGKITRCDL